MLKTICAILLLTSWSISILSADEASAGTAAANTTSVESIDDLIARAGSDDDVVNLKTLGVLLARDDLDASLRQDAVTLHKWLRVWTQDKHLPKAVDDYKSLTIIKDESPLYPLAQYYFARAYATYALQYGKIRHTESVREQALAESKAAFETALPAYPENKLIAMYLGLADQPWPVTYVDDPNAPDWANSQRRMLEGITDIIHWLIEYRQNPRQKGDFGSGRGDDVEMWRWWSPILVGFQDPIVNQGQERLSKWVESSLKGSYTSKVDDVEHTSEDSTDSFLPMMFAKPGDPDLRQHALNIAALFRDKWTGINERGHLQFKNLYISLNGITGDANNACDTLWHCRAILPSLFLWQQGEDSFDELFLPWLRTWVDATAREERGKPAGVIPSAIHWPSGQIGGPGPNWWIPEIYHEKLYHWPFYLEPMLHHFLHAWQRTGDESFLAPMHSMIALSMEYVANPVENPEPGSRMWCASKLDGIANAVAKYRILSGNSRYDDFLLQLDLNSYLLYRMTGDRAPLTAAFANDATALSNNFELYTSEVRFFDRGLNRPGYWYRNSKVDLGRPILRYRWNMAELYSSVTGDIGGVEHFPIRAVRWLTPGRNIAALVTQADTSSFEAELYHFGDEDRAMGLELWLLKEGSYQMVINSPDEQIFRKDFTIEKPGKQISFTLPAKQVCTITITQLRR